MARTLLNAEPDFASEFALKPASSVNLSGTAGGAGALAALGGPAGAALLGVGIGTGLLNLYLSAKAEKRARKEREKEREFLAGETEKERGFRGGESEKERAANLDLLNRRLISQSLDRITQEARLRSAAKVLSGE